MKEYHKSALIETLFILLFTCLPTIFGIFRMIIFPDLYKLETLYKSGEFFLYGVSLLSSSFLVYNHYRVRKSDGNSIFSILTIILIALFSLLYTALTNNTNPKLSIIEILSFVTIIISVPIFYHSQVTNNKNSPDIAEQRRGEQKTIENALK